MSDRVIEVVAFDEGWSRVFREERQQLRQVLGSDNLLAVHHIGSTSVAGLSAKPVIDMLLEVASLEKLDADTPRLESLGYHSRGEFGITGRRFFQKGDPNRTHHLHAFVRNDPNIERHLAFRDYLARFSEVREQYQALKLEGAALCENDIERYCDHKHDFIQQHEKLAIAWKRARGSFG
ncbi:GrpB family protein [Dongshaea marina]|uniref:GrpB family protein n=1 Tax=Dongshaea marina TaxID=2047966 RepID=UPI000D3E1CBA|nr:GrpB family protein [Dongshaea marina]